MSGATSPTVLESPVLDPARLLELPRRAGGPVVKIGVSNNLSAHTRELCAGCVLAAERWLGEPGSRYDVEFVWSEDSFGPEQAVEAAARLIDAGVVAVVGHLSSSAALQVRAAYLRAGIPFLAPGTSHPSLTSSEHWNVLRVCGRDEPMAAQMVAAAIDADCRLVAVLEQPIAYGRALGALLEQELADAGVESRRLVLSADGEAGAVAAVDGAQAVLFAGTFQTAARVLLALEAAGYDGRVVLGDDCFTPELPLIAGAAATGALVVSTPSDRDHPRYPELCRKHVKRTGLAPGAYSLTSYVATELLLDHLDVLLEQGARSFVATVKQRPRAASLLGPVSFQADGDLSGYHWSTYRLSGGRFTPVEDSEGARG